MGNGSAAAALVLLRSGKSPSDRSPQLSCLPLFSIRPGADWRVDIGADEAEAGYLPGIDENPPESQVLDIPELVTQAVKQIIKGLESEDVDVRHAAAKAVAAASCDSASRWRAFVSAVLKARDAWSTALTARQRSGFLPRNVL